MLNTSLNAKEVVVFRTERMTRLNREEYIVFRTDVDEDVSKFHELLRLSPISHTECSTNLHFLRVFFTVPRVPSDLCLLSLAFLLSGGKRYFKQDVVIHL